jgi:hypothetical protein
MRKIKKNTVSEEFPEAVGITLLSVPLMLKILRLSVKKGRSLTE